MFQVESLVLRTISEALQEASEEGTRLSTHNRFSCFEEPSSLFNPTKSLDVTDPNDVTDSNVEYTSLDPFPMIENLPPGLLYSYPTNFSVLSLNEK